MSYDAHDVIVVGGGLAGLTAARELRNAGRRVLILEGRDRLGGRAFTSQFAGTDVELGGMSVHWFQPHIFAEMTRYGITHDIPAEPQRWSYVSQGQMHDSTIPDLLPRMTELFRRCFPDSLETLPVPHQPLLVADAVAAIDHLSMQDRIDQTDFTAEERDLVNAVLATACSAPCSDGALTPDDHPITFLETSHVLDDGTQVLCALGSDAERLPPDDQTAARHAVAQFLPAGVEDPRGHRPQLVDRRVLARNVVGLPSWSAERRPRRAAGPARARPIRGLGRGRRVERLHGRRDRVRPARCAVTQLLETPQTAAAVS